MKKRLVSFLTALTLVSSILYGNTVDGVGEGYKGDIKVRVSYDNNEIKGIEVLDHQETNFTKRAMKQTISKIVETQSLDVDNVVGATYTCKGIKEAVGAAEAACTDTVAQG